MILGFVGVETIHFTTVHSTVYRGQSSEQLLNRLEFVINIDILKDLRENSL